jgi:hypothetical protein
MAMPPSTLPRAAMGGFFERDSTWFLKEHDHRRGQFPEHQRHKNLDFVILQQAPARLLPALNV